MQMSVLFTVILFENTTNETLSLINTKHESSKRVLNAFRVRITYRKSELVFGK